MTLTLPLSLDLEERLQHEAERQGLPADTLTLQLLDQHLPAKDSRAELVELLQFWIEGGDAQEQKETGEYLIQALDEVSDRQREDATVPNTLYYGDNLDILRRYIPDESVDLIYLDPPFNSNQSYNVLFAEHDGTKAAAQVKAFE